MAPPEIMKKIRADISVYEEDFLAIIDSRILKNISIYRMPIK
jgi:hypothetical protein